jgi:hypothetical protein
MASVFGAVPYLLILVAGAFTAVQLLKDWHAYKHGTLRTAAVVLLLVFAVLNLVGRYLDEGAKQADKQRQAEATSRLEGRVTAANEAQKANTKLFLDSFNRLSQRVGDLQAQVKTEDLQRKLASVQKELQVTAKALAPGPKAKLVFSFFPPLTVQGRSVPRTDVTVPVNSDGSAHVEFTVLNPTLVDAMAGSFILHICQGCKFAKEPQYFTKLGGAPDTERWMGFDRFLPLTQQPSLPVDVIPNPSSTAFEMGISYRCHACTLEEGLSTGVVHLDRSARAR